MPVPKSLAIGFQEETDYPQALNLSKILNCPIDNQASVRLIVTPDKLILKMDPFSPLSISFDSCTWQKRRDAGKKQALIRACKPRLGMTIIDATAGWGRDAAVLASFGANVIMLERDPLMQVLLADALAHQDLHSKEILRLSLLKVDAIEYLSGLSEDSYPDLIYLDPMHPLRQKKSLVKKNLQILQQLIGPDPDAAALLAIARQRVKRGVVVKWPVSSAPIAKPTSSITEKTVRFDFYQL